MTARPIPLILASGLLLVIGASGLAVAGGLLGVALNGSAAIPGLATAGLALGTAFAVYAFATIVAGVGLALLRTWAWRLGVLVVVVGLVALGFSILAARGADPILLGGVAFWSAAFVCLVVPPTRAAIRP